MPSPSRYLHDRPLSLRLNPLWLLRMAWRDSRKHRGRLLLFVSSISLGIGALVAVETLVTAMERNVDDQANSLLGADLVMTSNRSFGAVAEELFAEIGGDQSRQVRFSSMVQFSTLPTSRLVQVRTLEPGFPFYGRFETDPPTAVSDLAEGPGILVEDSLLLQFDAAVGDSVRVGAMRFRIAGRLLKIPGEAPMAGSLEPRVYIPARYLERTSLVQQGSRVSHRQYFKLPEGADVETAVAVAKQRIEQLHLDYETVASRKRNLGRPLTHLYRFLNLGSFIALLLGSVGVASAIHAYVRQKHSTIAILRSLGAGTVQVLGVYVLQALTMGALGSLAGILAGIGVIALLPIVVGDMLPIALDLGFSYLSLSAIGRGLAVGMGMATGFALLPLVGIRRVSPLLALRASYESASPKIRDPLRWVLFALIAAGITAFAVSQTRLWIHGVSFAAGLFVAFGMLALVAGLIVYAARRFFPRSWNYIWRQGLANLYRPDNQTSMLVLALGLGTFLMATLYMLQSALLRDFGSFDRPDQPNMVLIDIQTDQVEGLAQLTESFDVEIIDRVPIVAMQLSSVGGVAVPQLRDRPDGPSRWALNRDYRCTYRDHLTDSEELVSGSWRGAAAADSIFVSVETGLARSLRVGLGDEITFDVQGVPVTTVVGSIREVDWRRVQTNFLVLFPTGVLEQAPQFQVFVMRAGSTQARVSLQQAMAVAYPNVSTVDLELILTTINAILDKATLVIRFLALFSVATGLLVLLGVITSTRYQRMLESVLLRTLGARRRQVVEIMTLEYLFLGTLATINGMLLALAATWALTRFLFKIPFDPSWWPIVMVTALVIGATVTMGLISSRGLHDRPPLELLRTTG